MPQYGNHDWIASKTAFLDVISRHENVLQHPSLKTAITNKINTDFQDVILSLEKNIDLVDCSKFSKIEEQRKADKEVVVSRPSGPA